MRIQYDAVGMKSHCGDMRRRVLSNDKMIRPISVAKRSVTQFFLSVLDHLNLNEKIRGLLPDSLSILLYHRIDDPNSDSFIGFKDVVSARRETFAAQLDFLLKRYQVIAMSDLQNFLEGMQKPPKNAVLITFDDGYRDNLVNAVPELEARGLPATLFVTTGMVDGRNWPWWDWVAEAFRHARVEECYLPLLGKRSWGTRDAREKVTREFIIANKAVKAEIFRHNMSVLAEISGFSLNQRVPEGLMMSWDELRGLPKRGITVGAHTVTHPILTQTSPVCAEDEIRACKSILEREIGDKVTAFAYPNGSFSACHEEFAQRSGYQVSFAAEGGLAFLKELKDDPHAIRRVGINLKDDIPRYAVKAAGLTRFIGNQG